jgi:hypothetical protein
VKWAPRVNSKFGAHLRFYIFLLKIVIDVSPIWTRKSAPNLEFRHFGV